MQYPYYPEPNQFSPSNETLHAWLKTRKYNNPHKPGFFETRDHSRDSVWTTIAILIELSAMILTIYGASVIFRANHKLPTFIGAIIIVLLFVAFDFIGILLHGHDKPEKVKLLSLYTIERVAANRPFQLKELKQISSRTFLGIMLVSFSGILKILAILYFFGGISSPAATIILVLFYLVVIYIHIFHSGYWLSAFEVNKLINREYRLYHENNLRGHENPYKVINANRRMFETPVPMHNALVTYNNGRQTLNYLNTIQQANGATVFQYELLSYGCMWDEDVTALIQNFEDNFKPCLIDACIALQLSQVGIIV